MKISIMVDISSKKEEKRNVGYCGMRSLTRAIRIFPQKRYYSKMSSNHGVHGQLFTSGSDYALFRPTYPQSLYDFIFSKMKAEKNIAIDLGCGTGQTAEVLSRYFPSVIGIDNSVSQLASAVVARSTSVLFFHFLL